MKQTNTTHVHEAKIPQDALTKIAWIEALEWAIEKYSRANGFGNMGFIEEVQTKLHQLRREFYDE